MLFLSCDNTIGGDTKLAEDQVDPGSLFGGYPGFRPRLVPFGDIFAPREFEVEKPHTMSVLTPRPN